MTADLKEILDRIKNYPEKLYCLNETEKSILLDYITNLQQENEKLKYNARGQVNNYFKDKYADEVLKNAELKKENERLKEENKLNEEDKKWFIEKTAQAEVDSKYKSRCEKANEYIKDFIFEGLLVQEDRKLIMYNENLRKFENILNGSDENE